MICCEYKCRRCGHRFEVDVFEPGEAERERAPSTGICCQRCASPGVEQVRILRRFPYHRNVPRVSAR